MDSPYCPECGDETAELEECESCGSFYFEGQWCSHCDGEG